MTSGRALDGEWAVGKAAVEELVEHVKEGLLVLLGKLRKGREGYLPRFLVQILWGLVWLCRRRFLLMPVGRLAGPDWGWGFFRVALLGPLRIMQLECNGFFMQLHAGSWWRRQSVFGSCLDRRHVGWVVSIEA